MAHAHVGVDLRLGRVRRRGARRGARCGVIREQAHQRVEQLRLPHRLRQVGVEQPLAVAGLAPAERGEEHQRQRRDAAGAPRARARCRPSRACACRGSRGRRPRLSSSARSASAGDSHSRASMPHLAVCRLSTRRLVALSSTTSTRRPDSSGCTPTKSRLRAGGSSASGARTVKQKVEPWPGPSLSTHIRPPISSASRRLIASPSPVPPYLRVVDESACEKDWKSRPMPSGVSADAGVAHREGQLDRARAVTGPALTRQHHFARLGELDRIRQQVQRGSGAAA